MDTLWAPWRIKYINGTHKTKGCLFCNASKESADKKNLIIFRSKDSFCILNKFPYNNGHLMLCPYRHIKDINQLRNEEILDLFHTLAKMQKLLKETLCPDGFNVGINLGRLSGAGIPGHLHLHLVPRWKEDTNFMAVACNTKVISQSLLKLYDELHKRI